VEVPSQLFETFAWERVQRGAAFSERNIYLQGQVLYSKLDLELHLNYDKYVGRQLDELERELLANYRPQSVKATSFVRDAQLFFGGQSYYAARYYSYEWAKVLGADRFSKFQEDGVISAKVGMKFRREVLAKGASEDADVTFRNFMGRYPDFTVYLVRNGISLNPT
jgi:oligopeptidase A